MLLALVEQFHASRSSYRIEPVYQGDYFESLAKLRTAHRREGRAGADPRGRRGRPVPRRGRACSSRSTPSLAATSFGLVPALAQAGAFVGGAARPLWALPFNRSTPIAYYNKDVFRELGLAPPTTWEELRAVARAATKRGARRRGGRWGFECPIDWWFWVALVGQAGGTVIAETGRPTLGGEAGVRALELWQTPRPRRAGDEAAARARLQRLAGRPTPISSPAARR